MFRFISIVLIFLVGGVLGFWLGSQPEAAARSVVSVCELADTSAGRLLEQHQVDRVVRNLADALSLGADDRIEVAANAKRGPRCGQALAQLNLNGHVEDRGLIPPA
jgi:hypothetical protein